VEQSWKSGLPFRDRVYAGRILAERLAAYRGKDVLVLGIPRGGVPVAAEVARSLDAELDVLVARKLGAPGQEELAIGAVTANGGEFINEELIGYLGVTRAYLERVKRDQMDEARRREALFRGGRPEEKIQGRVVILVDDGLATGATMRAAARSARKRRPGRLIVAVPVGSREACADLRSEADEVVCPWIPDSFGAVGYFYENFQPTEDAEVRRILREHAGLSRAAAEVR
jgi:putative phosphoribosyl transferase